ncbi:TMEM165/GDT1 family protein [Sphingosinicella sp.]|uniref:TMEM165/GDT1 family protein n=1 Tax=Sphingosinicella sp. TaxID=1917971 RepID=UPI0040382A1C
MDALVASFVAAFLGEWGDRTQLLLAVLAARTARPGTAFAGIAVAVVAASLLGGFAGGALVGLMSIRAAGLLVALALGLAGLAGLFRRRMPDPGSLRLPLILAAFVMALAAQVGDRTPFITFALAARFDAPLLAAAGASAGALAACIPAVLLGDTLAKAVPLRAIRLISAVLFLFAGIATGLSALRLI